MPEINLEDDYETADDEWDVKILAKLNSLDASYPMLGIMTRRTDGLQRQGQFSVTGKWPNIVGANHGWDLHRKPKKLWFAIYPDRISNEPGAARFRMNHSLTFIQVVEVDFLGEWYHPGFPEAQTRSGIKARYIAGSLHPNKPRIFGYGQEDEVIIRTDDRGVVDENVFLRQTDILSKVKGFVTLHAEEGFTTEEEARESVGEAAIGFIHHEA